MSIRIMASSSPKRYSASVRASSVLANDPLVQHGLEGEEPLGLLLNDVRRGHAGPLLEDAGDVLARHLGGVRLAAARPTLLLLVELGPKLLDLFLDPPDVHRWHRRAQPDLGRGLIEEVDGLVR